MWCAASRRERRKNRLQTGRSPFAGELGIKQEECLYLGDTNTDMETGLNAGMDTVGVLWGFRDREELEGCHPQYIVAHPSEVAEIVKKKNESHGRME